MVGTDSIFTSHHLAICIFYILFSVLVSVFIITKLLSFFPTQLLSAGLALQESLFPFAFIFFQSCITGRRLTCRRPLKFICVQQELLKGFSTHGRDAGERAGPCAFFQTLLPVQPTDAHFRRLELLLQNC